MELQFNRQCITGASSSHATRYPSVINRRSSTQSNYLL
jgi:hypothetical protein